MKEKKKIFLPKIEATNELNANHLMLMFELPLQE